MWVSKTAMQNNGVSVRQDGGGKFNCDQCHWSTTAMGPVTNWLTTLTNPGAVTITNSSFDSTRTTNSATTQFMTINGGQFIFQNNLLFSSTEVVTRFVTYSTTPAVAQIPGNSNNISLSPTTIPVFSNVAPPATGFLAAGAATPAHHKFLGIF
jgi:hypothetical protein